MAVGRGTRSAAGAGFAALFVGIGLARFGYSPLIPALVHAGWFAAAPADYLSATNLAGYVLGAWMAGRLLAQRRPGGWVRMAMLVAAASFLVCARPGPFLWFFAWRLLAGIAAGWLMVLAIPYILERTPFEHRGVVGGVIFAGIGSGMVIAGAAVPRLVDISLATAWLGIGGVCLVVTALVWPFWRTNAVTPRKSAAPVPVKFPAPLRYLIVAYCANAIGFVPHSLFWVDYIARELGRGLHAGGAAYLVFGLAALVGPSILGWIGDRRGRRGTLAVALLVEAAAVALPLLGSSPALLAASGILVGGCAIGVTSLTSARTVALTPEGQATRIWGWMTIGFAVAYAAAGAGLAALYAATGSYRPVFGVAALMLAAGSWFALRAR